MIYLLVINKPIIGLILGTCTGNVGNHDFCQAAVVRMITVKSRRLFGGTVVMN